ncbi:PR domain zinc finger protein 8 [Alosa alosa]|uniref:PR domain zinc finger protein 8 n=1 Tax=Alosa alosa TaxID=278164 RepID=UPI0020151346|nr:PR domain zinc finger protein 8 [Alosa alosa]
MEHMLMSRALWTSDGKCVPTHAGDGFASVHVTRELPAGAAFGPCVLHNGFYDTIAFIALKARDTKSNCYAFRVDPEAMRSSPLALSWLRLVQAARNRVEQNTEVFLKAGQLFFRTLRHVQEGEELMVWYDEELARLLGLGDVRATCTPDRICCVRCGQTFQHEHPYLAHCRFLCPNNNNKADWLSSEPLKYKPVSDWLSSEPLKYKQVSDWLSGDPRDQRQPEVKRTHRDTHLARSLTHMRTHTRTHTHTDFHNIARDLEHRANSCPSPRKRCHDDSPGGRGTKSVLLEKANPSNESNIPPRPAGGDMESPAAAGTHLGTEGGVSRKEATPAGQPTEDRDAENLKRRAERCDRNLRTPERVLHGSVRVLRGTEEQRSAFCRPHRHLGTSETHTPSSTDTHSHTHTHSRSSTGFYSLPTPSADLPLALEPKPAISFRNVLGSALLYGDLPSGPPSVQPGYPYSPDQWPRGGLGVTPVTPAAPPASLPLLPPTLSPLAVAGQNWCAKCNLSFRMTSDLVLHMRSHHKREPASTMPLRRQREERMTCPVCHEHFRERHHLSRHMTSHN